MSGRGGFISLASFAVLVAGAASCDSFSEGESDAPEDGGTDVTTSPDATSVGDSAGDVDAGGVVACEAMKSEVIVMAAGVRNIAADALNVYAAGTTGVFRVPVMPGGGAFEAVTSDAATDVILTDNYVLYRRTDGAIHSKAKATPMSTPSPAYSNVDTVGLEPRTQEDYVVVRANDVYGCTAPTSCQGPLLTRAVRRVVVRGTSFDFLADEPGGIGVYHCASACNVAGAGTRLAVGGADVPDLVSDVDHLYWIDRDARSVRRVARTGGAAQDVIEDLVAPSVLALDNQGHVLVGTPAHGVYRGSIAGTCRAVPNPSDVVIALTVGPTGAFIATATELRKLRP